MTQARGARGHLSYVEEVTWGTTPGSPTMKLLKAAVPGESLGATIEEFRSNAINANRSVEYARGGNIKVGGNVPFELPILGIGTLLKHALGSVSTSGSGPYTHVIKRGSTLPAGLSIEKGFNDISQFLVFAGCKIDKFNLAIQSQGLVTGSFDVIGKGVTRSGTSLGSPTAVAHNPYVEHEAAVLEGGSSVNLLNFDLAFTNGLDAVDRVGSRSISALTEGKGELTGNMSVMFEDATLFNKWLNETSSTIKVTLTQGSSSIEFFLPNVRYFEDTAPKIANDGGVVVPLKFRGLYDSSEATDLRVTVINSESTL